MMKNPLENTGLLMLLIAFVAYLIALVVFAAQASWVGVIVLLVLGGCALLFSQAVKDRLGNKEDDYYSKNVDK